jgi:peptidyl-prolyl cis-trans isomerase SurA
MKPKAALAPLASLTLAIALMGPHPAAAQLMSSEPIDAIVAVVDEDVILRSELDREVNTLLGQLAQNGGQTPPRDVVESQLLERMIDFRVQLARADGTGIRVTDAEIEQTMRQIAQQNGITLDQMSMALARDGVSVQDFRRKLREQMAVERFRSRFVQQRVNVTATEIDNLIASGRMLAGEIRLSHILIPVPEGANPDQIAEAERNAGAVRSEIEGGLDFATAAIRHSRGPQALEGGDLGWRRVDQVPGAFGEALSQLKLGEVSPPFRGPGGFHIIKLADQRESGPVMVEEFNALHLMVTPSELLSADQARGRIEDLHRRISAGENFGDLARQFSDDLGSKNQGGDLGWVEQFAFGTVVGNTLGTLADGELSAPFQTEGGNWHLVKRLGTRQMDRSADRIRQQAEESIRNRKAEEEYASFVRQMRGEAYIENRLTAAANESTG